MNSDAKGNSSFPKCYLKPGKHKEQAPQSEHGQLCKMQVWEAPGGKGVAASCYTRGTATPAARHLGMSPSSRLLPQRQAHRVPRCHPWSWHRSPPPPGSAAIFAQADHHHCANARHFADALSCLARYL